MVANVIVELLKEDINFKLAEQNVKKLQKRIAVAVGMDDFDKVVWITPDDALEDINN